MHGHSPQIVGRREAGWISTVTAVQRVRQDDLRVPLDLTNPYSCKKIEYKKYRRLDVGCLQENKGKEESGMMFSVNDLKNVNSFVEDAQADFPAGCSTMSSASLSGPAARIRMV